MVGDQEVCPLTVEEAKARLLEGPTDSPWARAQSWVSAHPVEAVLAASGVGLVMAFFPRLRHAAARAAVVAVRTWLA